jgi:hypothetical protein
MHPEALRSQWIPDDETPARTAMRSRCCQPHTTSFVFSHERVFRDGADREEARLGRGHRETRLHDEIEQRGSESASCRMVEPLRGCRVFHFHDTDKNARVKRRLVT